MKLLVIEDDVSLAKGIQEMFRSSYVVDMANTGEEGVFLASKNAYDLIMIDILLPDRSGIDVCKTIREKNKNIPLMMLTGQIGVDTKIVAFDLGADDYVTKPFHPAELSARVKTLIRRRDRTVAGNTIRIGDLSIDDDTKQVKREGREIRLRRKEYEILQYLAINTGKVVSRDTLISQIWGTGSDLYDNTIDVYINYLRNKVDKPFEKKIIETIHGFGYRLVSE